MALQTPTPPPRTANPGRPSRLRVQWRRLRFALRRDPLSSVTSPALAIRLADELLARTAIAQPDTQMWCSVAVRPVGGTTGQRLADRHRSWNRMGAQHRIGDPRRRTGRPDLG